MFINVRQNKLSLSDTYSIEVNGKVHFTAVSQIFSALSEITLSPVEDVGLKTHIERIWSLFKIRYTIQIGVREPYFLVSRSILKIQFECIVGKDIYSIYGHKKRNYSIFKNGIQIASIYQE